MASETPKTTDSTPPSFSPLSSIEGLDTLLLRVAPDSTIAYVNSAFTRYFRVSKEDLQGADSSKLRGIFNAGLWDSIFRTDEKTSGASVQTDDRGTVFEIKASRRNGFLDVVLQDISDKQKFRQYVQRYTALDFAKLSEDDLSTFKYPERRLMTVSFADLRGFTAMSEKLTPEEVRVTINAFLEESIQAVAANGATVDKIVGDEVMALFGAPKYFKDHAFRALKTACDQIAAHQALQNTYRSMGRDMPPCGVGLNTGDMVVGNIGSSSRQDYTVLGSAVNLAARICGAAQGNEVVLTEATLNAILNVLPEKWQYSETREAETFNQSARGGKTEGVFDLPAELRGKVIRLGPSLKSNAENAEYELRYMQAIKVKGVDEPLPILSAKKLKFVSSAMLNDQSAVSASGEHIFGKYRLIESVGRGGMGEVWKARDTFGNIVAVKTLLTGENATEAQIRRMKREAQAMAKLQHPSICRIFEVGEVDNMFFIAMEFVEGLTLLDLLAHEGRGSLSIHSKSSTDLKSLVSEIQKDRSRSTEKNDTGLTDVTSNRQYRQIPAQQAVSLFSQICSAVQYAHEHGILHRDLKPSNVIIRPDGSPVLMDFGLAKFEQNSGEVSLTISGQIMGTIEYMAPEQAKAEKKLDERADVYSLGAMLYQMLAGKKHFVSSGNILSDAQLLQYYQPPKLRTLNKFIDQDLETIVMKSLSPDPESRYRGAASLREDLERWRRGEPIMARPVSLAEIFWKTVKRNKGISLTLAVSFLILLAAGIYSYVQISKERDAAKDSMAKEEKARRRADDQMHKAEIETAKMRLQYALSLGLANRWAEIPKAYDDGCKDWQRLYNTSLPLDMVYWDGLRKVRPLYNFQGHVNDVFAMTFSKDGKTIYSGDTYGNLKSWETFGAMENRNKFPDREEGVFSIAISGDEKYVATGGFALEGGEQTVIAIRDSKSGQILRRMNDKDSSVTNMVFMPDGRRLLSTSIGGMLRCWNVENGEEEWAKASCDGPEGIPGSIISLALSKRGDAVLTGGDDGQLWIWDLNSMTSKCLDGPRDKIIYVGFIEDENRIVALTYLGWLYLWDRLDPQMPEIQKVWESELHHACYNSEDNSLILAPAQGENLEIYGLTQKRVVNRVYGAGPVVNSMMIQHREMKSYLISSARDYGIKLWDLGFGRERRTFSSVQEQDVDWLSLSADGLLGLAGTVREGKQALALYDLQTGLDLFDFSDQPQPYGEHNSIVTAVLSPDGRYVAVGLGFGKIHVWDLLDGKIICEKVFTGHLFRRLCFSSDGKMLAVQSAYDPALFWKWKDEAEEPVIAATHDANPRAGIFSKEGNLFINGFDEGSIRAWETSTGKEVFHISNAHELLMSALALSPDGSRLVSASEGDDIKIWDLENLKSKPEKLEGHLNAVRGLAFDSTGLFLVSTAIDGDIKLWHFPDRKEIHTLTGLAGAMSMLTMTPDGPVVFGTDLSGEMIVNDFTRVKKRIVYDGILRKLEEDRRKDPNNPTPLAVLSAWFAFQGNQEVATEILPKQFELAGDLSTLEIARAYLSQMEIKENDVNTARFLKLALSRREAPEHYLKLLLRQVESGN